MFFLRQPVAALWRDLALTCRSLRGRPLLVTIVALTLALGIGVNSAVFSVVHALLLAPLPYADAGRLVALWPGHAIANRELLAIRERARTLSDVAGFSPGWLMALTGEETPLQLNAARLTGNMFPLLGVQPLLGRTFGPEQEQPGAERVVVLGYALWRQAFHADSQIVGRTIRLDGAEYEVLGVMPRGFQLFDTDSDLWTPLTMDPAALTWNGATTLAYGKLAPNRTASIAGTELARIVSELQRELNHTPDWGRGVTVVGLRESMIGGVRPVLVVLLGGAALVLLIAAANIATLLLVRAAERRRELAIRVALGATPGRIASSLLLESLLLGLAGGVLGAGFCYLGVSYLTGVLPATLPRVGEIRVNTPVLAVTAGTTFLTALLFGTAPALQGRLAALRTGDNRSVSGGGGRLRGLIVALAIALALVLGVGTALMTRTLAAIGRTDPGFRPDHVLTMRLQPSGIGGNEELRAYWREVLERVRGIPGVTAAGTMLHLPLGGRSWNGAVEVEGRPLPPDASPPRTAWQAVSLGGLEALGTPLVAGRAFGPADNAEAPMVVAVNQAFARTVFPGEDPLGRRIKAGWGTSGQWATVVGVVGDIRRDSLTVPAGPEIYLPFEQRAVWSTWLIVRTTGDPAASAGAVRERIWGVNAQVPIAEVRTLNAVVEASQAHRRIVLTLLGSFAVTGMLLGLVGVYGVVAYSARQRTREIGVRMALGATPGSVTRLVVRQGLVYALLGVAAGLAASAVCTSVMRGLVYGVAVTDPLSFLLVPMLLLVVAGLASLVPALRAARTDPGIVLRQ